MKVVKKEEKQKGITLVALVVTIIILLILAGVTLNLTLNEKGLFQRTQEAVDRYKVAAKNEEDMVVAFGNELDKYIGGENVEEGPKAEESKSYEGYYADLDGNPATAEGIVYADLAVGKEGQWNSDDWSNYKYETTTGLKSYVIGEAIKSDKFGNKELPIISEQKGTSGKNRFYVMALEDLDDDYHYWYYNAYGKLDKLEDYKTDINFGQDEPKGKTNTDYMISAYESHTPYGEPYTSGTYTDLWGLASLKQKVNEGWFVPSRAEWSAFGDMIYTKFNIDTSNYDSLGLKYWYWSSSQNDAYYAYLALSYYGFMDIDSVNGRILVRLSATF